MAQLTEQVDPTTLPPFVAKKTIRYHPASNCWVEVWHLKNGKRERYIRKFLNGNFIRIRQVGKHNLFPLRKSAEYRPKVTIRQREVFKSGKFLDIHFDRVTNVQRNAMIRMAEWLLIRLFRDMLKHNITVRHPGCDLSLKRYSRHGKFKVAIHGNPKGWYRTISKLKQLHRGFCIYLRGMIPEALLTYYNRKRYG